MSKDINKLRYFLIITCLFLEFSGISTYNIVDHRNSIESSSQEVKSFETYISKIIEYDNSVLNITSYGEYFEGYNVFILEEKENSTKTYFYIISTEGMVKYQDQLSAIASSIEFISSTTVMYSSPSKLIVMDIESNTREEIPILGHHENEYNPNNDSFFTLQYYEIDINGTLHGFDKIIEFDRNGSIIWSKDTRDFIHAEQWCPFHDMRLSARDITHSNSIFYDVEEDIIYCNVRNVNTFYKINHSSGEVIWGLGEYGNFSLYDSNGISKQNLFYHSHAVEKIDKNKFILFDNDYHNQTSDLNRKSRILEITIDENKMEANESWFWASNPEYWCSYYGDADRLPNNNRLGTFGTYNHPPYEDIGARIVEVNSSGDLVWEMNFPNDMEHEYAIYRTERVQFSPIISSPGDISIEAGDFVSISWDVWYNFRSKWKINGTYSLYFDNSLIDVGIHIFNKYWRSTEISFNLSERFSASKNGSYNITLVLADEAGHKSQDSVIVTILPNYSKIISTYVIVSLSAIGLASVLIIIKVFTFKRIKLKIIVE